MTPPSPAWRDEAVALAVWPEATGPEVLKLAFVEAARSDAIERRCELDVVSARNGAIEETLVRRPLLAR